MAKEENKKILEGLRKLNEAIEDFLDNMDMDEGCEAKSENKKEAKQ